MENPSNLNEAKLTDTSETFPPTYWLTYLNPSPGYTYIVVPKAGTLWVYYGYQQPAKQIYVWHQGGSTTPINPGHGNWEGEIPEVHRWPYDYGKDGREFIPQTEPVGANESKH